MMQLLTKLILTGTILLFAFCSNSQLLPDDKSAYDCNIWESPNYVPSKRGYSGQRDLSCQSDSIYLYRDDNFDMEYALLNKQYYTYDQEGKILVDSVFWIYNELGNVSYYTYNGSGQLSEIINVSYEQGLLSNQYLMTYTYNNEGLLESILKQTWNNGWNDAQLTEYVYDIQGNIIQEVQSSSGSSQSYLRSYDLQNRLIEEITTNINNGIEEPPTKKTWNYDDAGNLIEYAFQLNSNGVWVNSYRETFEFDSDNKILNEFTASGDSLDWIDTSWRLYAYNPDGTLSYSSTVTSSDGAWYAYRYYDYVIGENNGNSTLITYKYNSTGSFVLTDSIYLEVLGLEDNWYRAQENNYVVRLTYYDMMNGSPNGEYYKIYQPVCEGECPQFLVENILVANFWHDYFCNGIPSDNMHEQTQNSLGLTLYPNPTNGDFLIEMALPHKYEHYTVRLMNLQGELIEERLINAFPHLWEVNLPQGMYFVQVQSENSYEVHRLVIQH